MNSAKNYQTKQKHIILDFLQRNQESHMTAEQILLSLKKEDTPVSKATLYRFLDNMVEAGEVRRYNLDNTAACYQYLGEENLSHHLYHLRCNECGKIFHVDNALIDKMNGKIEKNCDFKIDQTKTIFYGTCKECMVKHHENL